MACSNIEQERPGSTSPNPHSNWNSGRYVQGTFPEPLQPAANSIVCTDSSDLLRDIFNQSFGIERPIRFPPRRCRTAASRCEQCLSQPRCLALGMFTTAIPLCGVCLSVTFVYCVETSKYIISIRLFSRSDSRIILVFPYQTLWQYSDGDPQTGAKIAILNQYLALGSMTGGPGGVSSVYNNFDRGVS